MRYFIPLLAVCSVVLSAGCVSTTTTPTAMVETVSINNTSCKNCASGRYCAPCVAPDGKAACASCVSVNACAHCDAQQNGHVAGAVAPTSGATTEQIATLHANGMSCPQCALKVDLRMQKIAGVDWTKVDLGKGLVTVGLEPGAPTPSAEALQQAVSDAGYTVGAVTLPGDQDDQ